MPKSIPLSEKLSKICLKYHLSKNNIDNIQAMILLMVQGKKVSIASEFSKKTSPVYKAMVEMVELLNKDQDIDIQIDIDNQLIYRKKNG